MFEALFGSELPLALRFFIAFLFVLGLIGGAAYLVRRFGAGALTSAAGRGRQPRLGVIESAAVDGRRRLVIIRRDNVEHLVMIGGPSDVVVETNIVRAQPASTAREPAAMRTAPEPLRAAPEPMRAAPEPMRAAPEPMRTAPEPMRAAPEPMARPAADTAMWPLQPEPVGRPQRQPMEEPEWSNAMAEPVSRSANADRFAGLAADLSRTGPEYVSTRGPADYGSGRPAEFAPARPASEPRRPAAVAPVAPPAEPPAPPPPPAPPLQAPTSSDEQNLADMAHRLEVALRRPTGAAPQSGDMGMIKPVAEPIGRPAAMDFAPAPPRPAPEPKPAPAERAQTQRAAPEPKPQDAKSQGTKSVYDSLEQEMASLLGRPSGKP